MIRAERDATPRRYSYWDPKDEFFKRYRELTAEQKAALHDQARVTKTDDDDASTASTETDSTTSSSSDSLELEGHRTARMSRTQTNRINRSETHPEALGRIETHRTQHSGTVGARLKSRVSTKQAPLPVMGAGKPYPPMLPEKEEYVVEFEGVHDPRHAQNWPMMRKLFIGAILAFDALSATMGSSIFSAATLGIVETFRVGEETATLGTSLFVLGYAFGPILWAPMSELYGRRLPLVVAAFGFSIFAVATATAKDLQTVMLSRFFGGLFGSCPLAVVAAAFADMFNNTQRGLAIAVFSATVFMGPLLAPFVSNNPMSINAAHTFCRPYFCVDIIPVAVTVEGSRAIIRPNLTLYLSCCITLIEALLTMNIRTDWRLHIHIVSRLEVDRVHLSNHGIHSICSHPHLLPRDLPPHYPRQQSIGTTTPNPKLGHPRQARRNRSRLQRIGHEERISSNADPLY